MERYKTYSAVHKGLRNGLSQVLFLAGNTDYSSKEGVEKIYKLGKKVFELMNGHAEDENNIVLAELEARMPGATHHDTHDHEKIEEQQNELETLLDDMWEEVQTGNDAIETGNTFFTTFSAFFGEYLLHMVHEETDTQQQLWDNFTDAELLGLTQRIVSKFSIDKILDWYSFMVPAMNPAERAMMFKGLSMGMPVEVFNVIDAAVKQYLTAEDYNSLKAAIETNQLA